MSVLSTVCIKLNKTVLFLTFLSWMQQVNLKKIAVIYVAMMILIISGCRYFNYAKVSHTQDITSLQKQNLVNYARLFLTRSKIPLSMREKNIINNVQPKTVAYYDAVGKGHIKIRWRLDKEKSILVKGTGPLDKKEKCNWVVSVILENKDIYTHKKLKKKRK